MIDLYYEFVNYDDYLKTGLIVSRMLDIWCKENCVQYFIFDILGHNIRYSFIDESDATGFKLRWL